MKYLEKASLSKIFIILFHIVGFVGFSLPHLQDFFISLVPFHLLLMAGILIANQKEYNKNFWLGISFIAVAGYLVEVVGVATGKIFGFYVYGETLGFKLANVPLLIGVNWVILVFAVGAVLKKYFKHMRTLKSAVAAVILVFIDFLIEPVAVKFDYWSWQDSLIPLQNFIGWFFVSFIFMRIYYELEFRKSNPVALTLVISQILFFIGLNLTMV
ncbi:carotenoid biosynthesis protein [Pedobacter alpinus]|uniref:Carotenoid biosynthesis protein n=1 Tax=Pedobacter alpinus TaxID=1590643 RepID=A0ABW5TR60_9SPHI